MPHVSKHKIEEKIFANMFIQLVTLQSGLQKKQVKNFIGSLLTQTEKVMLTKRCAAVLMLHQGCSSYEVWNMLKLSPSTVARLKVAYKNDVYDGLTSIFDKREHEKEKFWKMIELLSRGGLPSMGKERWASLRNT